MSPSDKTPPPNPNISPAVRLVPADEARRTVKSHLREYAELFEEHAGKLAAAAVGDPVLVNDLADYSGSYYLVPLFHENTKPYFVAQVAADSGTLMGIEGIRSPMPGKELWVYSLLQENDLEEKLCKGQQKYAPRSWQSTGRLVWRFCLQSSSPLEPFHELRRGELTGYMDVRGTIHTERDLPSGKWSGNIPAPQKHD